MVKHKNDEIIRELSFSINLNCSFFHIILLFWISNGQKRPFLTQTEKQFKEEMVQGSRTCCV